MIVRRRGLASWLAAGLVVAALPLAAAADLEAIEQRRVPPMSGVWALGAAGGAELALASTCQGPATTGAGPHRRNVAPNVNQITGDVINTGPGTNQGCYTPQNETSIAVNPVDPRNLAAGANDYRFVNPASGRNEGSGGYYYSFDGGKTWGNGFLPGLARGNPDAPGPFDGVGDPVVAFDTGGTAYYANIAFNRDGPENGVFVSTSANGGRTFGPPATVAYTEDPAIFNDKEWLAVDVYPHSPYRGTVYVTWTQFQFTPGDRFLRSPILIARSTDGGSTFSGPATVGAPHHHLNQFSMPVVAPNGDVYVAYENWASPAAENGRVMVARSTDGGSTFTHAKVDDVVAFPLNPATGRETLTGARFRVHSGPAMAASPVDGTLYVVWADNRNGTAAQTNGDVFISRSTDGGATWSAAAKVNSEAGAYDQFFPAVAVGGDGSVHVSFYDRQFVGGGDPEDDGWLDYAYAHSDDGARFRDTERVTTGPSDPNTQFNGTFIGDYTAIAAGAGGNAYLSWTDSRGRPGVTAPNQDAYFQRIGNRGAR